MALGNGGNQNKTNTLYEPSYYSRLRFTNYDDKLALGFTFWKGALKISISESGSANEGRNNELAYIHLSPIKARIFAESVQKIIEDPETFDIYGIDTGSGDTSGFIAIGRDMGKPYLFIARVNSKGGYDSSQRFNFNFDRNYTLKVNDLNKLSYQKEYNNDVELQMFRDALMDYSKSASGAVAASVHDVGRYEAAKINNIIRKVGESMGVAKSYGGGNSGNGGFFNDDNSAMNKPTGNNSNNFKTNKYKSSDEFEDEFV